MKCENCSNDFPATIVIEGKRRNLSSRRFCLECSPFKSHNTSKKPPVEGLKRCVICNQDFPKTSEFFVMSNGKPRSFCKTCDCERIKKLQRENKAKAVAYKGGCCQQCGYSKYQGALEFHHTDPESKDFNVSDFKYAFDEAMKRELDKCILLCANCHREAHQTT